MRRRDGLTATPDEGVAPVHVGCSGWSYPNWSGPVYPPDLPSTQWLRWYADHLGAVELNTTFYRLPSPSTVENWCTRVPEEFRFAVKMGGFGSHRMKLRDAARWLPNHLDRVLRLGDRLGPTLVQLPPRWRRNAARLDEFLEVAPRSAADRSGIERPLRWAVEVRDASWLDDEVFDVLARHGAALCIHDLLPDHPRLLTTDWTYVRLHGPRAPDEPYAGLYGATALAPWAEWFRGLSEAGVEVDVYFDNDQDGHAFRDARRLRAMLEAKADRT